MEDESTDWRTRAACRHVDPEIFFPAEGGQAWAFHVEAAVSVCRMCPVRGACADWAVEQGITDGVWGGLSPSELRRLRWRQGVLPRPAGPSFVPPSRTA